MGVAGGVPHFTDFYKHVRPGDVVVATPNQKGYMYIYCDNIKHDKEHVSVALLLTPEVKCHQPVWLVSLTRRIV